MVSFTALERSPARHTSELWPPELTRQLLLPRPPGLQTTLQQHQQANQRPGPVSPGFDPGPQKENESQGSESR